jgi:lysophospholipase L1-like esterase
VIFLRNFACLKCLLLISFLIQQSISFAQQKQQPEDTLRYKSNPIFTQQLTFYDIYKIKQADIIMLGNSLTHGVDWHQLLGRNNVISMGITSDVLRGYLARLNYVFRLKPRLVFIMGGLNDIYNWTSIEDIFSLYVRLIEKLRSKDIIPIIQSTTYAAKNYAKEWGGSPEVNAGRNHEVEKLNRLLSEYAKRNKIDYIDLNSRFVSAGYLREELTWDGIHFKAEAYRIWGIEVEKVLQKYKL